MAGAVTDIPGKLPHPRRLPPRWIQFRSTSSRSPATRTIRWAARNALAHAAGSGSQSGPASPCRLPPSPRRTTTSAAKTPAASRATAP
jgi:hypothetical protein